MKRLKIGQVCKLLDVPYWRIYKAEQNLATPIVRKRPHQVRWYSAEEVLMLADYLDVPIPAELKTEARV